MTSNFSEVFGINEYCGPAVLSALTGKSTDLCAAVISAVSGKNVIKAVEYNHLLEAIKRLNFEAQIVSIPARSLFGVISALINIDSKYIIAVPNHYVAVEIISKTAFFIDNHTKQPMNAIASARLTQEVKMVWRVKAKSQEEIKKEQETGRKIWLNQQISSLNYQIGNLVARRDEYERELDKFSS